MSDREGWQNRWQSGCLTLLKIASGILLAASLIYLAVAGVNYAVLGAVFYEGEKMGTVVTIAYALALFALSLVAGLLGMRATYDPSRIVSFCIASIVMVVGVLAGMASNNFGYSDSAFGNGAMGGLSLFFGVVALVSAGIGVFVVKPEVLGSSAAAAHGPAPAADVAETDAEGLEDTGELVGPDVEANDDAEGMPAGDGAAGAADGGVESADAIDEEEPSFQPAPEPRPRGDVGSTPLPKVARTAMPHSDEDASDGDDAFDGRVDAGEMPAANDAVDLDPVAPLAWEDNGPNDAPGAGGPHDDEDGASIGDADGGAEEPLRGGGPSVADAEVGEIEWVDFGAGRVDDLEDEGPAGFFGKHRRR